MLLKELFDEPDLSADDLVEIVDTCEQNKWLPPVNADDFIRSLLEHTND